MNEWKDENERGMRGVSAEKLTFLSFIQIVTVGWLNQSNNRPTNARMGPLKGYLALTFPNSAALTTSVSLSPSPLPISASLISAIVSAPSEAEVFSDGVAAPPAEAAMESEAAAAEDEEDLKGVFESG